MEEKIVRLSVKGVNIRIGAFETNEGVEIIEEQESNK